MYNVKQMSEDNDVIIKSISNIVTIWFKYDFMAQQRKHTL